MIVGGGPGGAALALLLASRGVETILLERQHDFSREFRGETMMPSGLEMLDQIGVDLKDVPTVQPLRFRGFRNGRGFLNVEIDPELMGGRRPMIVSQPHLLEHLVALAGAEPAFRFVRGGTVRDLLRSGDRVSGVRMRTDDGEQELRARLVVGADGRASVVRRRGGFPVETRGAPMDIVWFKVPRPDWPEYQLRFYLGGGHLLIALPAPDGLLQVAWVILKATYGELRNRGVEEWAREMAGHVDPELGEHLRAHVPNISRPFLLDSETDRVRGWASPGVLLIGDAAHTMSPVGGQGLNLALRDAVVAANCLVPAFRSSASDDDLDAAARAVEAERGHEIDQIQRLAAVPPRVVMGTRFYHTWARAAVTTLLRTSFVRVRALPVANVFLRGVSNVELRV